MKFQNKTSEVKKSTYFVFNAIKVLKLQVINFHKINKNVICLLKDLLILCPIFKIIKLSEQFCVYAVSFSSHCQDVVIKVKLNCSFH